MKPTKILNSGKKVFYLDLNDNVISIGDSLKVKANSGSNFGAVKKVEGVLESIDEFGNFIINGEKLIINKIFIFHKSNTEESWFKCYEHSMNGYIYSVEKQL